MRDTSEYAFSPALGYAAAFMSLNTFVYCMLIAFIFWVATLGDKAKSQAANITLGAAPAMAGGAPSSSETIESVTPENHK